MRFRAAQTCWARSDVAFPFTTSTHTPYGVVPAVCVAWWGKESKHGLCLLASLGGWGCTNASRIDELLVLFLFLFVLPLPSTVRY